MRVLVNQLAAIGQRTGVGHYTAQLLRCLRDQAQGDEIDACPQGWMWLVTQAWTRATGEKQARDECAGREEQCADRKSPVRSLLALPRSALHRLRRVGRTLRDRAYGVAFKKGRYDVYHEPNFLPLACDLPTVITIHDLSVLLHPDWHPLQRVREHEHHFLRGLAQCSHILTVSDFVRRQVIENLHFSPDRVTRTYNGIRPCLGPLRPDQTARTLRRLQVKPNYLLYVGTIEPRKNILMVMRAYCGLPPGLRERVPLLLAGNWGWKAGPVVDYYERIGRHHGVRHLGYVPDRYLAALYNGARGLVYPSLYEGFGLPPVEMMACGGAVLASDIDALAESTRGQAHLIDPRDEDAWQRALARLIQDDDWWLRLRRGTISASRIYTWNRCAADTLAVYRLVAARASASRARAA
jgi:alpha-1,3-rhamnosyl/mannosyltransferase